MRHLASNRWLRVLRSMSEASHAVKRGVGGFVGPVCLVGPVRLVGLLCLVCLAAAVAGSSGEGPAKPSAGSLETDPLVEVVSLGAALVRGHAEPFAAGVARAGLDRGDE